MREQIKRGDKVIWQAGTRIVEGRVIDTYIHNGINALQSTNNIYNASGRNALLIELTDGSKVLKLETEVNPQI